MTAPQFGTAAPVIPRVPKGKPGAGRPLITPPGGGEPVPYERTSSLAKALDDGGGLMFWKVCMTLKGASQRPALVKAAQTLTYDENKGELYKLGEQCMEAAGASDKATDGTTMHKLSELVDSGRPLPAHLDEQTLADLEAYRKVMAGVEVAEMERFVVCDELQAAGSFDRLARVKPVDWMPTWAHGRLPVLDLKTGNYVAAVSSIAIQLAIYSRSHYYNPTTGERTPTGADQEVGFIVGLPLGEGRAELIAVDLNIGWQGALAAKAANDYRAAAKLACKACDEGSGWYKNGNPCRSCQGVRRTPVGVTVAAA